MAGRSQRTSREYVHSKCGNVTVIDGPEFAALADPLANMIATYCAECEDNFAVSEFAWTDTGERISDYYERHRRKASPTQRLLASRTGMFAMSAAAGLVALVIGLAVLRMPIVALILTVVAAMAMIALHTFSIGPMILERALGTNDARQLV